MVLNPHVCWTVYVCVHVVYHRQCLKINDSFCCSPPLPSYCCSAPLLPFFIPLLFFTHLSINSSFILLSFSSAQALCLSDEPRAVKEYRYPEQLPGELYDADTQCKWQFGEKAKLCTLDFKKVNWLWLNYAIPCKCKNELTIPCHALILRAFLSTPNQT